MKNYFFIITLLLSLIWCACSKKVYYSKNVKGWKDSLPPDSSLLKYTVFLIGDAGDPELVKEEPTFKILREQMEKDSNSSVVFLGDNIYDFGLPSEASAERERAQKKMDAQLAILNKYKGRIFFISGNHDWQNSKKGGFQAVKRQEQYIEEKLNKGNTFVPDQGCPGPYRAILNNDLVLIAMDSQWWLHDHTKPYGNGSECNAEDESDVMAQLDDYIESNKNKNILMVAHHPLFSNGNHGGYYSLVDYIFPLRLIKKYLYIPLPFLGALYPLHRKFGGTNQDIVHYKYQAYKKAILNSTNKHDHLIYAAGHDHNLQYQINDSLYHIVSGAGSKLNPVKSGSGATFVKHSKGFAELKYYKNNQVWVEFWTPHSVTGEPVLSFRYKVYEKKSLMTDLTCGLNTINYKDSTVNVAASETYKRTALGRVLLGGHYREEWNTAIEVPLIDFKTEHGGLIPYGKGGGKQSLSLKLKDTLDREFSVRSIKKDPTKAIPAEVRNTFLHDLVKDQVSAQHPFGAIIVPTLADAAGVYHTNPKLVVVPNDSCLGPYREEFKNMLAIFEEDPDENHENIVSLGRAKNIVGTEKMISELEENNHNRIDQKLFIKSRLFDMLLGDWDRHERQYRWAEIPIKEGKLFKPIPEDRDQVFFNFDGILPWLVSRKWGIRNLQDFDYDYKDVVGLNQSAKKLDRRLINSVSQKEWMDIADQLKNSIKDADIENAINQWPEEIRKLHGREIVEKLKSRRDKLPEVAIKYYKILSNYVDVFGTQKSEIIYVHRLDKGRVWINIIDRDKKGRQQDTTYNRMFNRSDTKEIRIYGLGGEDRYVLDGNTKRSILIRIVGGREKDSIADVSHVKGLRKKTIVYDSKKGNIILPSSETNEELSSQADISEPGMDVFNYNSVSPQLKMYYNIDDGVYLGAGLLYSKYKFRRVPFSSQHQVMFNIASATGSKKIEYTGIIKKVLPALDFTINLSSYLPYYIMNYFGYGNESKYPGGKDISAYRVKLENFSLSPTISRDITRFFKIGVGVRYDMYKVGNNSEGIAQLSQLQPSIFNYTHFVGLKGYLWIGAVDNKINPTRGIGLSVQTNLFKGLNGQSNYTQNLSEFTFYITPNLPFQLTFAGRAGGGINTGSFQFYQANILGSGDLLSVSQNLRGFRKTRFIGDKSFYQNAEIRLQLLKFNVYFFPGRLGVLGFVDNGRVWAKNEYSKTWHTSYGVGPWINIFNKIIFTSTFSLSSEEKLFNFRLGYSF